MKKNVGTAHVAILFMSIFIYKYELGLIAE